MGILARAHGIEIIAGERSLDLFTLDLFGFGFSLCGMRSGAFAWDFSFGNCFLGFVAKEHSLDDRRPGSFVDNFHLEYCAWEFALGSFRLITFIFEPSLGTFIWDVWLGILGLGCMALDLWLGTSGSGSWLVMFGLISLALDLWLGIFGLEPSA